MRRSIVAVAVVALAVAALVSAASASFDSHFSVIGKQISGHRVGPDKFRFEDRLLNPRNRHDRVGRDWGVCKFRQQARKLRCRATVHLNGDIGGFGDISVRGDLGRHDNRVNVVGGTHDFNGIAGKLKVRQLHGNTDRLRFALVR